MKKRLLSVVLAAMMLCSMLVTPVFAEEFTDIAGLSCETAVKYLAENNVVSGRGNGEYAPTDTLTRAEMVTIILRGFGADEVEFIEMFVDVPPSHWAYEYVETAFQMGIVAGTTETRFSPEDKVTFEQAVKMLVCAINKGNKAEEEGGWPDGYIKVASELGMLEGIDGQKGQEITRGTMAELVYTFLTNEGNKFGFMYDWENSKALSHYDWIRDEKMRAIYGGCEQVDGDENGIMKRAENAGANAVFMNLISGSFDWKGYDGCKQIIENTVEKLKGYDMHAFMKINYGDNNYAKNDEFATFHPGNYREEYFITPCHLNDDYWNKQLYERSLLIASYPEFDGIILDFEMYHGGTSSYPCACMCDDCWAKYIAEKGYSGEWSKVDAVDRSQYVKDKKKKDEYDAWNKQKLVEKFAALREAVHEINPNIIFAYMPNYEYIKGITEGLGTPERPVIILSEKEYWGSFAGTPKTLQKIKDQGHNALLLPGLYTDDKKALTSEQFEKAVGECSTTTQGFWIYNASYFGNFEANYGALENANKLLDERIESGELVEFPTYDIHSYTAAKIKGDKPTEAEWEKAPYTEDFDFYKHADKLTPIVETRAKILYSNDNIFVRVEAYDDMSTVEVREQLSRDGKLWVDNNIEICWMFDEMLDSGQFATDVAGSIFDAHSTGVGSKNTNVDYEDYESEVELFEDRWQATLQLPASLDGVKKIQKGDMLRMVISRYHRRSMSEVEGGWPYLVWTPTNGSFLGNEPVWGYVKLG